MILATKRLILRPIRMSEARLYFENATRSEVNFSLGIMPPKSAAYTRGQIREALKDWKRSGARTLAFSIYLKRKRVWVGGMNLRWPHRGVGELGYAVHPKHWGKGYATEAVRRVTALAFEKFAAHRVQATCWVKNPGSMRVLEKSGFRREGRLRGFMRIGDKIRDEFSFAITRADFSETKS